VTEDDSEAEAVAERDVEERGVGERDVDASDVAADPDPEAAVDAFVELEAELADAEASTA